MPDLPQPPPAGQGPAKGISRRDFLTGVASLGAASCASPAVAAPALAPRALPVRMHAGHQHDHSKATLTLLAALGVNHICSSLPSRKFDEAWSVAGLTALRKHVESFGIQLDCVPLPLSAREVSSFEYPEILLGKDPEREHAIGEICQMIRNAAAAGIPMLKYNLSIIGYFRTAPVKGRGGATMSAFDYTQADPKPLTQAGLVTEKLYWERIEHFLERVVPVAEKLKVRIALHPQDPGFPPGTGFRGVDSVLGTVAGLQRFVSTCPSEYHGLNFCQGTIAEMLRQPREELPDVIRWFGTRGKIFMVHFRNIRGGFLNFNETLPDDGDVSMPAALRVYRDVGYGGMIMPDHVPSIEGDPDHYKAYSFCFGYIQALLQVLGERH